MNAVEKIYQSIVANAFPSLRSVMASTLYIWLLAMLACGSKPNQVEVFGVIEGKPNGLILLREASDNQISSVDSATINDDGHFNILVNVDSPKFLLLQVEGEPEPIVLLVEANEKIEINGKAGNLARNYQVSGSKGSALVKRLNSRLNQTVATIDSLSYHFRENREHPKFDSIKVAIDSAYSKLLREHKQFTVNFIQENRYSLASILALYQQYSSKHQVLNKREDFLLFELVDASLHPLYPNNTLVITLNSNVKKMAKQMELYDRRNDMLSVDQEFPPIDFPSIRGESFQLKNIRARYTLIDFWATWCNECAPNNKLYKPIYKEFKAKGFEIVQFSLDEDQNALQGAIERDSLLWHHASDFKVWESPIIDSMHINSIPANYLVDRNGVIIARNLTPKELKDFLKKNLP